MINNNVNDKRYNDNDKMRIEYMKDNIVRYSICFHRPQGTLFENQYSNILLT